MARIRVSADGHEVAALVEALPQGRFLLGLSGAPGSGKSTLAPALAAAYGAPVPVVAMDGFHRPEAELRALGRLDAKGAPDTFDAVSYAELLRRLGSVGDDVRGPVFEHGQPDPLADRVVVPGDAGLVITEGNYLLLDSEDWRSVRRQLGAVWHLVVDEPLRLERLIERHVAAGRTPEDARAWVERVDQPNARLVEAASVRADLVLDVTLWSGRVPHDAS